MAETIILIDDDNITQFIHKRTITKHNKFKNILTFPGGEVALDYLKDIHASRIQEPKIILLDLNMPSMNGWEFLEEYKDLDTNLTQHVKLFILRTSSNPRDIERSQKIREVSGYINKHLTSQKLDEILKSYSSHLVKRKKNIKGLKTSTKYK